MHRAPPNPPCANAARARSGVAKSNRDKQQRKDRPRLRDWQDVACLADQLEVIADWKKGLQKRIAIAQFRFELLDADHDLADLEEEAAEFCRACRTLMWRPAA
jgi:hypothetical protein